MMPFDLGSVIDFYKSNPALAAAYASSISASCFFVSLFFALIILSKTRRNQKEATARSIFNDYLKLAFDNPIFAYPPRFANVYDVNAQLINGKISRDMNGLFLT